MSIRMLSPQHSLIYALFVALAPVNTAWADTIGGIATDGTLGAVQVFEGTNVTVAQSLGTTTGNNLFHSFADFNINSGQSVTFTGADNLQNVFSRVTGTNITKIEGTLKSTIANAAFFFINPNGITFGADAQVDVPGAFHVSTADTIDFPNNGALYADRNQASTLSSEAPAAFGFLQTTSANNGLIEINGTQLAVKTGQTLTVSAANIDVNNSASLAVSSGEVRLEAVGIKNVSIPVNSASQIKQGGAINISSSTVDSSGNGAGKITVRGGEINVSASNLLANNTGDKDASNQQGVDITADSLAITDGSRIRTNVSETGKGGDIAIAVADRFEVTNSSVRSSTTNGQSGNININAKNLSLNDSAQQGITAIDTNSSSNGAAGSVVANTETLQILNGGWISSDAYGAGNAGSINISSNQINLDAMAQIESSAWDGSTGNAGSVSVKARTINMDNNARIYSTSGGTGRTGTVSVAAVEMLDIVNNSAIQSYANHSGNADDLTIKAGVLNLINGGSIWSYTSSSGNAGNLSVKADTITLDNQGSSNTSDISSYTLSSGKAGNVQVESTGTLTIANGANINSASVDAGDVGDVSVKAGTLTIKNELEVEGTTGISTRTLFGSGKGGTVNVESAGALEIGNGGNISSFTLGSGDAGNVSVKSASLSINGLSTATGTTGIYSGPASQCTEGSCTGKAGSVAVDATGAIEILNGGTISNSTSGSGDAGNISVNAGSLNIEGIDNIFTTGIYAMSTDSGNSGNIDVNVNDTLSLLHGGAIDTSTFSLGKAGDITVKATELRSDGKTDILQLYGQEIPLGRFFFPSGIFSTAKYGSSGQTGSLNITAAHLIQLSNRGKMSIENQSTAVDPTKIKAGNIAVNSATIAMEGSEITSNSTGNVAAGNIVVNFTDQLNMDSSFIATTANTGDGGNITINGGESIYLQNAGFTTTVSGADGNGGDIFTTAEVLAMDTGLIQANAVSGSGGDIALNLTALIPSGNSLLVGGSPVIWQPSEFGFNLIQAASQTGVSGTVNVTAPQLNLSGIIANLSGSQFDTDIISQDYCGLGTGSSLTRTGAGGLKPKSGNQLLF